MHDIGVFIWAIVLIFGVISSIVRNAQRANARRQAVQQPAAPSATLAPPAQQPVQAPPRQTAPNVHAQFTRRVMPGVVMPPVESAVPPPPVRRPAAPKPELINIDPVLPVRTASPIRGMFDSRQAVVRAIVASQVLGPPLALQEHSIWSPRHSEPSI